MPHGDGELTQHKLHLALTEYYHSSITLESDNDNNNLVVINIFEFDSYKINK